MVISTIKKIFIKPVRLDYLNFILRRKGIKVLDVGCGDHSPSLTKSYFPDCLYYGVDRSRGHNLDEKDFECMEAFFEMDLTHPNELKKIPDNFFDCIIFNHVIEHLPNGKEVLAHLTPKLMPSGIIYVEFPGPLSIHLPSFQNKKFLKGTLNFYDDPTHVSLFSAREIKEFLEKQGLKVLRFGTRHSWKRILLLPLYLIGSIVIYRSILSGILWDLTGFANYVVAIKDRTL